MTWKSCDRVQNGLEGLRVQKDWEESRQELRLGVTSRDNGVMECFDTNIFFYLFFLISFLFLFNDDEEAHDITVT